MKFPDYIKARTEVYDRLETYNLGFTNGICLDDALEAVVAHGIIMGLDPSVIADVVINCTDMDDTSFVGDCFKGILETIEDYAKLGKE